MLMKDQPAQLPQPCLFTLEFLTKTVGNLYFSMDLPSYMSLFGKYCLVCKPLYSFINFIEENHSYTFIWNY